MNTRMIGRAAQACLGAALASLGGCASGGDGWGYQESGYARGLGPVDRYDDWSRSDQLRLAEKREERERLRRIPREADRVAGGRGDLDYTAPESGKIYVRDQRTGKVIYRGRVEEGQTFRLDADDNRAYRDDKVVDREIGRKAHKNEIYFDAGKKGRGSRDDDGPPSITGRRDNDRRYDRDTMERSQSPRLASEKVEKSSSKKDDDRDDGKSSRKGKDKD